MVEPPIAFLVHASLNALRLIDAQCRMCDRQRAARKIRSIVASRMSRSSDSICSKYLKRRALV